MGITESHCFIEKKKFPAELPAAPGWRDAASVDDESHWRGPRQRPGPEALDGYFFQWRYPPNLIGIYGMIGMDVSCC